ncbi:hypothetical protein HAX54_052730 [Datura stramonium]|uniref:Uncharacterized protein n=1 Tax=Datura stramonium TaxID=4076 RepID=A0ABS8WSM8_DATST|nr:hypothetical protein [Datura stramonium]
MPNDLLKIAQMAQEHESHIVKLSKAIPSMIQQAIKKAMQPTRDTLRGLCATVEVLENAVTSQPEAPKSPSDDWWVGYDSSLEIVSNEEIHHSEPSPPPMLTVKELDPSWKPAGWTPLHIMSFESYRITGWFPNQGNQ